MEEKIQKNFTKVSADISDFIYSPIMIGVRILTSCYVDKWQKITQCI